MKNGHQTKLNEYALPKGQSNRGGAEETQGAGQQTSSDPENVTLKDIMAAIQDVKGVHENKIDSTAIEVTLIRTDLRKISDRIQDAEESMKTLTSTTGKLDKQVK